MKASSDELIIFVAVVESRSFSRAANSLTSRTPPSAAQ